MLAGPRGPREPSPIRQPFPARSRRVGESPQEDLHAPTPHRSAGPGHQAPNRSLYGRLMHANVASIMPQVITVWCEHEGHDVNLVCYTGLEDLIEELPADLDVLFIGAFTQSAQLAYALSTCSGSGAVTVLGGPMRAAIPRTPRSTSTTCSDSPTARWWPTSCGRPARIGPMGSYVTGLRASPRSFPPSRSAGSSSRRRWPRPRPSRSCR